ncbi:MAG: FAD-dependent oxidoreductase [Sphingobacteriales bacterium]|nr:MAG: FAD-dependent oxidoreductase [Sphingobacteriales bacterium]
MSEAVVNDCDAIVVGSGPVGVAVALQLLKQGFKVLVLDKGREIEPEISKKIDVLKYTDKHTWKNEDYDVIKGRMKTKISGPKYKTLFGSTFPYSEDVLEGKNVFTTRSQAKGGFSNVWGSGSMPFHPDQVERLGYTSEYFYEFVEEATKILGAQGLSHSMSDERPSVYESKLHNSSLTSSPQAQSIIKELERQHSTLKTMTAMVMSMTSTVGTFLPTTIKSSI